MCSGVIVKSNGYKSRKKLSGELLKSKRLNHIFDPVVCKFSDLHSTWETWDVLPTETFDVIVVHKCSISELCVGHAVHSLLSVCSLRGGIYCKFNLLLQEECRGIFWLYSKLCYIRVQYCRVVTIFCLFQFD